MHKMILRRIFQREHCSAVFELTNRCNLRCRMCDIWKEKPKRDFNYAMYEKLLSSKIFHNFNSISLTGGEPFLMDNLEDYFLVIKKHLPNAYINISTNGYFTSRIISLLGKVNLKKISICISYDGIDSHDKIRGCKGSRKRLLKTVREIKENFPELEIILKFVISEGNKNEIYDTAKESNKMKLPFEIKIIENIISYHNRHKSIAKDISFNSMSKKIISRQVKQMIKENLCSNKIFARKLLKNYNEGKSYCNLNLNELFFCIDGSVYICRKKVSLGNIHKQDINEILSIEGIKANKKEIITCNRTDCLCYSGK